MSATDYYPRIKIDGGWLCSNCHALIQESHRIDSCVTVALAPPMPTGGDDRPAMRDRMLSIDEIRNLPPPTPLIDGLIDLDSLALFYGQSGHGKTFLATEMTICVATGRRWHHRLVAQSSVIYALAEGVSGQAKRFDALLTEYGVTAPTSDQLVVLPEPVNLLSPSTVGEFANIAADKGAKLIVLDTFARCMVGGDENSAKDAGLAIEQLDVIRRRTGACVVVVHHTGKDTAAGPRGSSAIEAAADSVFRVGTVDEIMTIQCTKQKHHAVANPIRLRMRSAHGSVILDDYSARNDEGLSDGERLTLSELQAIALDNGVSATSWEQSATVRAATFYRHRKRLVTLGLVSNVGSEKQPRYQVSDLGALALSGDSHALSESEVTTISHSPLPIGVRVIVTDSADPTISAKEDAGVF